MDSLFFLKAQLWVGLFVSHCFKFSCENSDIPKVGNFLYVQDI